MAKYIELEAAIQAAKEPTIYDLTDVPEWLSSLPTADVAPVRHGRWVEKEEPLSWCEDDVDVFWECSVCEARSCGESPYCPNCGARMDGEG